MPSSDGPSVGAARIVTLEEMEHCNVLQLSACDINTVASCVATYAAVRGRLT
jgi:hypothetical protein